MYSGRSGFGDLAPSFKFTNTSRPGSESVFRSGESWLVEITGPSNQPVSLLIAGQDSMDMGATDGNGNYVRRGTVGDGEIGNWYELWYVGNPDLPRPTKVGTVSFSVVAAPETKKKSVTDPPPGGGNNAPPPPPPPVPFDLGAAFGSIPPLVLWAGAGLLAFSFLKGKR